jgi:cobalt-zinc-cadmium efflux system membrane fusion protein
VKKICIAILAAAMLAACSRNPQAAGPAPKAEAPEPLKATVWTAKGELYLEYPTLVLNQRERFAIHLTRLGDFKAVKDAACQVHLERESAPEDFPCDPSTHPGIFGANVEPKSAGPARLSILVHGKDLTETFDVGPVKIAADAASAERPPESKEETISFSKEQQWALDYGTQVAGEQILRDNLRVAAETLPRTGGEAAVIAPLAGRLVAEKNFSVGTAVGQGTEMASIVPPTGAAADLTGLQLAEAEAKVALEQAQRDRARAERLFTAGAVPARRAEEARTVEATVQARLQAAQTRLAQYDATRTADGVETGAKRFLVRAPISGIISESSAISGSNVEVGKVLFRIVDIDRLFVSGVVPESEFSKLRQLSGAEIEMPDTGQMRPASRLVAIGRLVDSETRTVPVTYETDNRDHRLAVNQMVFLRLLLTPGGMMPVIPESAIIDDGGRPVVFVQKGGETFLRRPVKLGLRNNGMVQALEGVNVGDRVVTKGAYLIRLSTMSSAVPAHGHIH